MTRKIFWFDEDWTLKEGKGTIDKQGVAIIKDPATQKEIKKSAGSYWLFREEAKEGKVEAQFKELRDGQRTICGILGTVLMLVTGIIAEGQKPFWKKII